MQYIANHAIQIDAIDYDSDEKRVANDDHKREFNAELNYYWDFSQQPTKFISVKAKRENYAKGSSKLTVDFLNYPKLKLFQVEVDRKRSYNQTELGVAFSYETEAGQKNRLDFDSVMTSDRDSISFSIEAALQRPTFNVKYANQFER